MRETAIQSIHGQNCLMSIFHTKIENARYVWLGIVLSSMPEDGFKKKKIDRKADLATLLRAELPAAPGISVARYFNSKRVFFGLDVNIKLGYFTWNFRKKYKLQTVFKLSIYIRDSAEKIVRLVRVLEFTAEKSGTTHRGQYPV